MLVINVLTINKLWAFFKHQDLLPARRYFTNLLNKSLKYGVYFFRIPDPETAAKRKLDITP